MKRPLNLRYSVAALALMAMFGMTGCPQDAKEETKSAAPDPAAAPALPAQPTALTPDPAAPAAVNPPAAPAPGEAAKPEPSKPTAVNEAKEPAAKKTP